MGRYLEMLKAINLFYRRCNAQAIGAIYTFNNGKKTEGWGTMGACCWANSFFSIQELGVVMVMGVQFSPTID